MSKIAKFLLKIIGWTVYGEAPTHPKFVFIAAPHTSNWDLLYMLLVAFTYRIRIKWLGKDSLFRGMKGPLLKWLGGIPIDRASSNNMVEQAAQFFKENERLVIGIPPEGTREKVSNWKSGFYYIALAANVPIVFGFIDYKTKRTGVGPSLVPSGDIEADMKIIRDFYQDIEALYPEKKGEIKMITKDS